MIPVAVVRFLFHEKKYVMKMRGKIKLDKGQPWVHLEFGRQWRCGRGAAYLRRQTIDLAQYLRRFNSDMGYISETFIVEDISLKLN